MSLTGKPPDSDSTAPHHRLEATKELLEIGGLELPGTAGVIYLWRRLGWKGALLMMLLVGFPAGEYSALRYAVYWGLPRMVGNFGLEFEAEEWSIAPFSMRAVARNVSLSEPHGEKPVFTAAEVEFQGSAWTLLRGLPDMLTFHVFGGEQPFNEIVIKNAELHLERSLTGHLNWADFIAAVPQAKVDEALDGVYRVNNVRVENFRVTYIEHVPGGSGDGLIRTSQAQVKVDEITGNISDLVPPEAPGARPTRFKFGGRSADGTFEVTGAAALFPPRGEGGSAGGDQIRRVSTGNAAANAYPWEMSVYLDNIAAAAYGRMVPVTAIVPVNGVIAGTTTIVYAGAKPECKGSFTMTNVKFAPNPLVLGDPDDMEVVRRAVAGTPNYTGPFMLCESSLASATPAGGVERPAGVLLTSFTRQATRNASPAMRAIVDRDNRAMRGEEVDGSLDALTSALAQEMGLRLLGRVDGRAETAARQNLAERGGSAGKGTGNALTSGVKSVGSGIKRLFGGGKKDDK
jgi:hypothetical protein